MKGKKNENKIISLLFIVNKVISISTTYGPTGMGPEEFLSF